MVHSFDGTAEELAPLLEMDNVWIGINGCSLREAGNLEVMASIPLERLVLETGALPHTTHVTGTGVMSVGVVASPPVRDSLPLPRLWCCTHQTRRGVACARLTPERSTCAPSSRTRSPTSTQPACK